MTRTLGSRMSISNMLAPAGTDMAWLDLGEKPKLLHDRNSHSSLFRPIMAPQHVGTMYIARLPVLWGGFWSRTSTHGPRPSTHSAAQSSGAGAASAGVCHQLIVLCHYPPAVVSETGDTRDRPSEEGPEMHFRAHKVARSSLSNAATKRESKLVEERRRGVQSFRLTRTVVSGTQHSMAGPPYH